MYTLTSDGSAMRMNIYVPDDLAEEVKALAGLNVSAVCQEALRAEVTRRRDLEAVRAEMYRIVVDASASHDGNVAFTGRPLGSVQHDGQRMSAYLTTQQRLAIHDEDQKTLKVYDSYDALTLEPWTQRQGFAPFLEIIAREADPNYVAELEI